MSDLRVLLIGASGAWGALLVKEFIAQKASFDRIAISARSKELVPKFENAESAGIEIAVGSFLEAKSYEGFSTVLSLVRNPVLRLQPGMIEAAVQGEVTHFYPSEWTSDIDQPATASMRCFRDKQATRAHLDFVAKQDSTFRYTIFVTGFFTEWSLAFGWDHEEHRAIVYGDPGSRIGSTSIPDIARYTVLSLFLKLQGNAGAHFPGRRVLRVQGSSKPYGKLVADSEAVTGKKYHVEYRDPAEANLLEEKARQEGDEAGEMRWSLRTLLANGFGVADGGENKAQLDNNLFAFVPEAQRETFERFWKRSHKK